MLFRNEIAVDKKKKTFQIMQKSKIVWREGWGKKKRKRERKKRERERKSKWKNSTMEKDFRLQTCRLEVDKKVLHSSFSNRKHRLLDLYFVSSVQFGPSDPSGDRLHFSS